LEGDTEESGGVRSWRCLDRPPAGLAEFVTVLASIGYHRKSREFYAELWKSFGDLWAARSCYDADASPSGSRTTVSYLQA
jgi:hypothetical protein